MEENLCENSSQHDNIYLNSTDNNVSEALFIIPEVVAIFCAIFGTLGNLLTFFTILLTPKLRQNPNYIFICNLSISDFLYCIFPLPFQVAIYHYRTWVWNEDFCSWLASIKFAILGTTLSSLCAIALNRYVAVVHPQYKQRLYTTPKIILMLCLSWLVPLGLSLLAVFSVWGEFSFQRKSLSCTFGEHDNSHRILVYGLGLFMPILFMALCYTRICLTVYKSQKKIKDWLKTQKPNTSKNQDGQRSSRNSTLQLTRSMIIVFVVFTVCFAPVCLTGIFDSCVKCIPCHLLLPMLSWIQITLNPVLYTLTNIRFRQAYKALLNKFTCPIFVSESDSKGSSKEPVQPRTLEES